MHLRNAVALFIGALLFTSSSPSSQAQRSDSDRSERWELLGEKKVGLWLDRDVIKLDQDEGWYKERSYRQIRFDVEDNDIHLNRAVSFTSTVMTKTFALIVLYAMAINTCCVWMVSGVTCAEWNSAIGRGLTSTVAPP